MASVPTGDASAVLPQSRESRKPSDTNSRGHKSDLCESIPNFSQDFNIESSTGDVLCASCSQFYSECSVVSQYNHTVIGISTVGATLSNGKCPSCRLIAYCIECFLRTRSIPPEIHILLWSDLYHFVGRTGHLGKEPKKVLSERIAIRLLRQSPETEEEINVIDSDEIAVLLPVMKDDFRDSTGLAGHEALFTKLEYQDCIYARPTAYTADVELLKTWINYCTASHGLCRKTKTPNDASTELRLIDVVERRLIDATLAEEYIALSYVWGSGNNKVLIKSTLEHLREKGSLNPGTVPRLIADVIDFVAEVNERYLWIDTVCIIQDDPLDKQRQLPNMSSIYAHAKFTVVAAVENSNDPLPKWNKCQHKVSVPTELIRGVVYTVGGPSLGAALAQTTWNTRGWTLQEALLARRLLVFTRNSIYWNCREESWYEDQYTEFHNIKNQPTRKTSLFSTRVWDTCCNGTASFNFELCEMGLYAQYAETYSRRSFSNYSDIVWAFLGVLKSTKENFPNGYIWALPYDQLDAALLWSTCCEQTQCAEHQYELDTGSRLPIPSWCWIGKGHKIWFVAGFCETKSRLTWHKPVTCWSSGIDTIDENQEPMHLPQAAVLSSAQSITKEIGVFDYALLHFTAQTTMLSIEPECHPRTLEIFTTDISDEKAGLSSHPLVTASIFLSSKRVIGHVSVPAHMFRNNTQHFGEFVLLSEYTGDFHSVYIDNDTRPVGGRKSGKVCDHDRGEDGAGSPHQEEEEACENENDQNQDFVNEKKRFVPEEHAKDCLHKPALNVMLIEWDATRNIKNFARRVGIGKIDPSAWKEVVTTEKTIILG